MKVLLLGGGGREHALAWKIRQSPLVEALFASPGNAGIEAEVDECVSLEILDPVAVADWAERYRIGLVVIGPEAPLVAGVADELEGRGIPAFGPSKDAAALEGSKVYAKKFMAEHEIPTARFRVFNAADEAKRFVSSDATLFPLVVKADGLAAGKGVILCDDSDEAAEAIDYIMVREAFGEAGRSIVVEERLTGREASFFVLTDGRRALPLATCQDYKRLEDGDEGPNTGGMGGFSPSPFLTATIRETIQKDIVAPTLAGLASHGRPYRGVLYVGVMLTADGPKVLEYNARFGDPETQLLMPRLDCDIVPFLAGAAKGQLGEDIPSWKAEASVGVVLASGGYPGPYRAGVKIEGLETLDGESRRDGIVVFHAGTRRGDEGSLVTSGGRVLSVVALGGDIPTARRRAYEALRGIRLDGCVFRNDIASDVPASGTN